MHSLGCVCFIDEKNTPFYFHASQAPWCTLIELILTELSWIELKGMQAESRRNKESIYYLTWIVSNALRTPLTLHYVTIVLSNLLYSKWVCLHTPITHFFSTIHFAFVSFFLFVDQVCLRTLSLASVSGAEVTFRVKVRVSPTITLIFIYWYSNSTDWTLIIQNITQIVWCLCAQIQNNTPT